MKGINKEIRKIPSLDKEANYQEYIRARKGSFFPGVWAAAGLHPLGCTPALHQALERARNLCSRVSWSCRGVHIPAPFHRAWFPAVRGQRLPANRPLWMRVALCSVLRERMVNLGAWSSGDRCSLLPAWWLVLGPRATDQPPESPEGTQQVTQMNHRLNVGVA